MTVKTLYCSIKGLIGDTPKTDLAFRRLVRFGRRLYPEYRFSWPQLDWWKNKSFNNYLSQFDESNGFNTQRRWILTQLIRLTRSVQGDTAECGVYFGCGSKAILECNKNSKPLKCHHAFDSFEGISDPAPIDGTHWNARDMSVGESTFRNNVGHTDRLKVYKGWIPLRFHEVSNLAFSFVHIDVDLYEPTKDSIAFFYERISHGGILVCDDYGFDTCPGATKAIDEFLLDKPEKMLALADGGGFFIKGTTTSEPIFDP